MSERLTPRIGDMRVEDENGEVHIMSTQRADGSWRPQIRVKKGYIPQEEIGVWKSRAQLAREEESRQYQPINRSGPSNIIPGASAVVGKNHRKNEKRRQKREAMERGELVVEPTPTPAQPQPESVPEPQPEETKPATPSEMTTEELKKVEKRLRKKLRQIALLEEKMVKEELEEEQKQKLATKPEVEKELEGIVSELAKREE